MQNVWRYHVFVNKKLKIIEMKTKIKEIASSLFEWFGIVLAMAIFAVISVLLAKWMQDKLWIVFLLDVFFCICLWLLGEQVGKYYKGRRRISSNTMITFVILIFAMALTLFVLAAATLGLLDKLIVRLNVILFIVVSFTTIYLSFKRRGIFD